MVKIHSTSLNLFALHIGVFMKRAHEVLFKPKVMHLRHIPVDQFSEISMFSLIILKETSISKQVLEVL